MAQLLCEERRGFSKHLINVNYQAARLPCQPEAPAGFGCGEVLKQQVGGPPC